MPTSRSSCPNGGVQASLCAVVRRVLRSGGAAQTVEFHRRIRTAPAWTLWRTPAHRSTARARRSSMLIRRTGSSSEWRTRSRTSCSAAGAAKSASKDP